MDDEVIKLKLFETICSNRTKNKNISYMGIACVWVLITGADHTRKYGRNIL